MSELSQVRTCPECGKKFEAVQARNGRTPEHCSKRCYLKAWRKQNEEWRKQRAADERQLQPVAPVCKKCGQPKTWRKDSHAKRGYRWKCQPCNVKVCSDYYGKNRERLRKEAKDKYTPEVGRADSLKRNFGITPEERDAIEAAQGGVCAICGRPEKKHRFKQLCVDHDHSVKDKRQSVRGMLCSRCNMGIGHFEDDSLRLQKAIRYLNGGNQDLIAAVLHGSVSGAGDGGLSDAGSDADHGLSGERAEA